MKNLKFIFKKVFFIFVLLLTGIYFEVKFGSINYLTDLIKTQLPVDSEVEVIGNNPKSSQMYSTNIDGKNIANVKSGHEVMSARSVRHEDANFLSLKNGVSSNVPDANLIGESVVNISPATYLNNPRPTYPEISLKAKQEGQVILRAEISIDGLVEKIEVAQSSGYKALDASALQAVKKWQFSPANNNGVTVSQVVKIPIKFELRNY